MPSTFTGFDLFIDNNDGSRTMLPNQAVNVYDVTHGAVLAAVTSDANGHVASASLDVNAGATVRFWVDLGDGRVGFNEIVTA